MRKKIMFILLLIFSAFVFNVKVDAATCKNLNDLKTEANLIEVNYELVKEDRSPEGDYDPSLYYHDLYISNISDNFEVRIGNNTYSSSEAKNGVLTIRMISGGYKLRVQIYGTQKSGCNGEKIRSIPVKLPFYNRYSEAEECVGHTNEYPICAVNADTSKYVNEEFKVEVAKQAKEYKENKEEKKKKEKATATKKKSVIDMYIDNAGITVPITILIIAGIAGVIFKLVSDDKKKAKIDLGVKKK